MASVNITNQDKHYIKENICKYIKVVAEQKYEPHANFREYITKKLLSRAVNYTSQYIEGNKLLPLVRTETKHRVLINLAYNTLPSDMHILTLSTRCTEILDKKNTCMSLDDEDQTLLNMLDPISVNNSRYKILDLTHDNFLNEFIDDEIKQEIEDHNKAVKEVLEPLQSDLAAIIKIVKTCNTTKQFEAKLPSLVSMYTDEVKRKLEEKEAESRKDKEDDTLQRAISSITTGKLLLNNTNSK